LNLSSNMNLPIAPILNSANPAVFRPGWNDGVKP